MAPGQGVAAELGAPEVAPEDGDPAGDAHHLFDAGDGLGRCRVEGLDAGPEAGRVGHQGREHPGQAHVLGEAGAAVELAGAVLAAQPRVADEAELRRVLEADLGRHRLPRRRLRQFAEARPPARALAQNAGADLDLIRVDLPALGRRSHQHLPGRGPGLAQLFPGVGHGGAAAGPLGRSPEQVVVTLGVRRGPLRPDLVPAGVEFLSHQGRQPGVGPLAHLQVLDDDRHRVVGPDAHEGIGLEDRRGALCATGDAGSGRMLLRSKRRQVDAEGQAGPGGQPRLEEGAAAQVFDLVDPHGLRLLQGSCSAACLMAARMRA